MKQKRIFSFLLIYVMLFSQILNKKYEDIIDDTIKCTSHLNTDTCPSVELSLNLLQCCKVEMTVYIGEEIISTSTMCSVAINPIKTYQEELEKDTTKALFKEMWGYSLYNPNSGIPSSMKTLTDYTCKDGSFSLKFGFDTYTDDEIEILKGGNHCLSYFYGFNQFTSKEKCYNALILPSSEKSGLSCGYFEFTIKFTDGTSVSIKTCDIFNKDVITNGHLDDKTKESFQNFVNANSQEGKIALSYVVSFSDNKGNNVVYDSLTQSIKTDSGNNISLIRSILFITLLLLI